MIAHQGTSGKWAVMVALLLSAMATSMARAASLSFTPAGAQLDADPIKDIALKPGDQITFKVMLDTNGLAGPLQEFKYQVTYDRVELEFINANLDPNGKFGNDTNDNPNPGGNLHNQTFNVTHTNGAVPANTAAFVLDEFTFKARAKDSSGFGLDNSGERDFYISILNAKILVGTALVEVNQQFGSQDVEVQPVVPLPAGAWMGLSLLAALAIIRRYMSTNRPATAEIPVA